jgi:hypothetical protein
MREFSSRAIQTSLVRKVYVYMIKAFLLHSIRPNKLVNALKATLSGLLLDIDHWLMGDHIPSYPGGQMLFRACGCMSWLILTSKILRSL